MILQRVLPGLGSDHPFSESVVKNLGLTGRHYCDPQSKTCLCPRRNPEAQQLLAAVGGLQFRDLPNNVPIPLLPEVIHTFPGNDGSLPFGTRQFGPAISTRFTEIRGLRSVRPAWSREWRRLRDVPLHRLLLIHQESLDKKLEMLYPATLRSGFFEAVKVIGNVVLVTPGYSIYDDGTMCELHQDYNLARIFDFAVRANQAGIPCIPCIGWDRNRPRHLERIAEWLIRQEGKVTHLAVNAQTGSPALWEALADGMAFLERKTGCRYTWLAFGGIQAMEVIFKQVPPERVIHVSATAVMRTLKHRRLGEEVTNDLLPEELLRQNLELYAARKRNAVFMAEVEIQHLRLL